MYRNIESVSPLVVIRCFSAPPTVEEIISDSRDFHICSHLDICPCDTFFIPNKKRKKKRKRHKAHTRISAT